MQLKANKNCALDGNEFAVGFKLAESQYFWRRDISVWVGVAQCVHPISCVHRQARRYATTDEKQVIIAASQLLQDLGFNVENSAKDLGLLVVSKDRSAVDGGQVAGQIAVAVLFGVRVPVDKEQKIRASVVTWPSADRKAIDVRVTFQRLVWDDRGQLSKLERLDDPEMYQDFYIKLSKALFLEAQEVG